MFQLNFEEMQDSVANSRNGAVLTLAHLKTYHQELAEYITAPKPEGVRFGHKSSRLQNGICWYIHFEPSMDYRGSEYKTQADAYAIWEALAEQTGSVARGWNYYGNEEDGRTYRRLEMAKKLHTELAELIGRLEAAQ